MFELTETIEIDQNNLSGGSGSEASSGELIKGGFPRIRICDEEFLRRLNDRKPREFSNKEILPIKQLLERKKSEPLFDSIETTNIIIDGGSDNKKKINGISIDAIIGKK